MTVKKTEEEIFCKNCKTRFSENSHMYGINNAYYCCACMIIFYSSRIIELENELLKAKERYVN